MPDLLLLPSPRASTAAACFYALLGMPSRRHGASGFRGVRTRPNVTYYAEFRASGFRIILGM
jgi:hypothetical protein